MWNRRKKNMMTRLTQIFGLEPIGKHNLLNKEINFIVTYAPKEKTVEIRINTFVNPYTQDVEKVYQERIDRISAFTEVCEDKTILDMVNIQANEPSKLGSMQIVVTIEESWATDDVLTRLKDIIYQIHSEQVPNESLVWFKSEYNDNICYFEGNMWWYPKRAVIMGEEEYERLTLPSPLCSIRYQYPQNSHSRSSMHTHQSFHQNRILRSAYLPLPVMNRACHPMH